MGSKVSGGTPAETCRLSGWGVGTVLYGEEHGKGATIRITAIGEEHVLARRVDREDCEALWTLCCRDWREVEAMQEGQA